MRLNYHTSVIGDLVILVPYRPEHVEVYHNWMKDPYILEMTASEPLSYEEECEMQRSWCDDPKKCTFIIVSKSGPDDEILRMAGDVNLFLNDRDDSSVAEIEVMIAEEKYRRKGFATEALISMMQYGVSKLNINRFYAKIHRSNSGSLALFQRYDMRWFNFTIISLTDFV